MIQRISAAQLKELTELQREVLRQDWIPQEGDYIAIGDHEEMVYYLNGVEKHKSLPLLNVGQLIALLNEQEDDVTIQLAGEEWVVKTASITVVDKELCYALWQAFKAVLDREEHNGPERGL